MWPFLFTSQGQGQAQQEAAAGHRHQVHQDVGEYHQATRRRQALIPKYIGKNVKMHQL